MDTIRCRRRQRILKDKESIERGYGHVCYAKRQAKFIYQIELRFEPRLIGTEKEKHEMVNQILGIKKGQGA